MKDKIHSIITNAQFSKYVINLPETLSNHYQNLVIFNSWSFHDKTVTLSIIITVENVNMSNFCAIAFIKIIHKFNIRVQMKSCNRNHWLISGIHPMAKERMIWIKIFWKARGKLITITTKGFVKGTGFIKRLLALFIILNFLAFAFQMSGERISGRTEFF